MKVIPQAEITNQGQAGEVRPNNVLHNIINIH